MGKLMLGESVQSGLYTSVKRERQVHTIVMAVTAVWVFYLAWYLHKHSDFSNDDLDNFVLMRSMSFSQFLLTPAEVHYVPLHRFVSWLIYHIAPMDFSVAITVVVAFHIGTLIVIWRTLRLLQAGPAAGFIVCGYAASAVVVYGLIWWSHALHRAPYVFLDAWAIYSYLAWMRSGKRRHLFFIAVAFVTAFGFYEKAVLIPVHMLLLGYLSDENRFRTNARTFLAPPLWALLGSVLFAMVYLLFNKGTVGSSPLAAIRVDVEFAKTFFAAASGVATEDIGDVPEHGISPRLFCLIAMWGAAFLFSIWRGQGSWRVLLAMPCIVMLDYLPIVLPGRRSWMGLILAHQSRFGYEELHLLALLLGIWCSRIAIPSVIGAQRKAVWALGYALLIAYMAINLSYIRAGRHHPNGLLWVMNSSHNYLKNVRAGVAQIPGATPTFENDKVPRYLSVFWTTPDTRTMLPLFLPLARFDDTASPRYRVLQDGHIVQLK
jgi:hypothetical protein